jgi:hypothetical protein
MSQRRFVAGADPRLGCFSGNTTEVPVYFAEEPFVAFADDRQVMTLSGHCNNQAL